MSTRSPKPKMCRRAWRRIDRIKLLMCAAGVAVVLLHLYHRGRGSGQQLQRHAPPPVQEPETIVRGIYEAETIAGSGLRQEGYLVWGGSVIEENGLYHLFVSRWPTALGHNAWTTSSEVAHAVSTSPLGPWTVRDVALPRRGKQWWDGMATHNPTVHWHPRRREYVLYYIGMTFDFAPPKDAPLLNRSQYETAWNAKRVGVATSTSLDGPWRRSSRPVLEPRVGHWDGGITSNPAVTFLPNGTALLFYKSIAAGYPQRNYLSPKPVFHIGAAVSRGSDLFGNYRRVGDEPIFKVNGTALAAEDPYLWRDEVSGRLHLLYKPMQPVRAHDAAKTLIVPAGWLAYTHTLPGGDLSSWVQPMLAVNHTLKIGSDDAALGDPSMDLSRSSWWRWGLAATPSAPGLPAVTTVRRQPLDVKRAKTASTIPVADPLSGSTLTFDRIERPQLLFSQNGGALPTHCFVSIMLNGSSANAVLRLTPPAQNGGASS